MILKQGCKIKVTKGCWGFFSEGAVGEFYGLSCAGMSGVWVTFEDGNTWCVGEIEDEGRLFEVIKEEN